MPGQSEQHCHDDRELLIKQYSVLVELIKHQHTRIQDFHKTFLTANTIIIGACALLLRGDDPALLRYLDLLCLLGIAISLIWICVSARMSVDSDLRWFQARDIESTLSMRNGPFSGGHRFFFQDKLLDSISGDGASLTFPAGIRGLLARFRVVWVGTSLPVLFMLLYVVLVLIGHLA